MILTGGRPSLRRFLSCVPQNPPVYHPHQASDGPQDPVGEAVFVWLSNQIL